MNNWSNSVRTFEKKAQTHNHTQTHTQEHCLHHFVVRTPIECGKQKQNVSLFSINRYSVWWLAKWLKLKVEKFALTCVTSVTIIFVLDVGVWCLSYGLLPLTLSSYVYANDFPQQQRLAIRKRPATTKHLHCIVYEERWCRERKLPFFASDM